MNSPACSETDGLPREIRAAYPAEVCDLYDKLRALQEPKGYFFNKNIRMALDILEQLSVTKARYGYMACPCRMAAGLRGQDEDIICPCAYRQQDVHEYGSCFCGLYVSKERYDGTIPDVYVPDRRPPERIPFGRHT